MESKSRKMKFADLKDMLKQTGEVYGNRPAYIFKDNGSMKTISHKEFRDEINALGTVLINMGLKDKRIAVISENRYEWELSYLAIAAGVGVVVPLDKALPDNELESLILRSQVEAIFYSSKYDTIMNTLREKKNTNLKYFISMDLQENTNGIYSQKALQEKGKKLLEEGNKQYLDAKIDADKMGIMLFTSGTTAMSKAVMLSHKNLVTNVMDIIQRFDLTEEDRFLSFLPLHHVFECTVGFLYPVSIGGSIAFCEGVKHMADNIKEFDITAMISVPAVFDIIYRKVMKTIEKKGKMATLEKGKKISNVLLKVKIDLRKIENCFCSFFVICHGTSGTHIAGLTDAVEEKVREDLDERPFHIEGLNAAQWVVVDYGDIVVHIFEKELRDYYQLEDFWADAQITEIAGEPEMLTYSGYHTTNGTN